MDAGVHTDLDHPTQTAPEGRVLVMGQTDLWDQPWEKHVGASKPTGNLFLLTILQFQ